MSGRASTYEDVWVEDLAYQRANVYWVRVTAEMFQVVENRTKIHDSSRFATYYS